MHRTARETIGGPARYPCVGLDVIDFENRIVATADTWSGIIGMLSTLRSGEYHVLESGGERLAYASVDMRGAATLRFFGQR